MEAGRSKIQCLVRTLFRVCRWLFPHKAEGEEETDKDIISLLALLIRALIPFRRLHTCDLIPSQRPCLLTPSHWGFRHQHQNLGGTQAIAHAVATVRVYQRLSLHNLQNQHLETHSLVYDKKANLRLWVLIRPKEQITPAAWESLTDGSIVMGQWRTS